MIRCVTAVLAMLAPALATTAVAGEQTSSPYRDQVARQIKALSQDDIRQLESGAGMGLAKAAELNGWPGPRHVIDLGDAIALSEEQRAASHALLNKMQSDASTLGKKIIAAEKRLDQLFKQTEVDPASISEATATIAALRGKLRAVHLNAHTQQARILTAEQRQRYIKLRGYENGEHSQHKNHHADK